MFNCRANLQFIVLISPFSFLSIFPLVKLAANSLTDLFSTLELLRELVVLLPDNVGGRDAGPLTPLSVDSSKASPESGVLPAEVFGLEPSLSKLNSPTSKILVLTLAIIKIKFLNKTS